MSYKVAVVGATGNVGREMLNALAEREFPVGEVYAVASSRSAGHQVSFGEDNVLKVQDLEKFDFKGVDIVLASAGAKISAAFAPRATKSGAVVIDNSSMFRMDKDVPLVVPEVNPEDIKLYKKRGIIANPNCSTIQMTVALKPLHDMAEIKRIVVATYQSVSGAGKAAMDELFNQTRALYANGVPERSVFAKQICFNVIPQIDIFMDDGSTKEEWKMAVETKKILGKSIDVTATCVRVPVFVCHAEAVNVEFKKPKAWSSWTSMSRKTGSSLRRKSRARMRFTSAGSARMRPSSMASTSGSSPTISARARRPMRCRSPRF